MLDDFNVFDQSDSVSFIAIGSPEWTRFYINGLKLCAGVSKRTNEWSLWRDCICDQQHDISDAVSDINHFYFRDDMLLYGSPSPGIYALSLLCIVPICKCDSC